MSSFESSNHAILDIPIVSDNDMRFRPVLPISGVVPLDAERTSGASGSAVAAVSYGALTQAVLTKPVG